MSFNIEELKREINRSVMIYIIGCCCFVLVALASLCFGYYVICYHHIHELPLQFTIISLAGLLLLWEMIKASRFKTSLPKKFKPITKEEYPSLFGIINEVTTTLGLSPICKVYVCPDATAAVFIQPQLCNIIFEPKRNLVIGMAFLTQMDDNEIRAVLFHEFGHYVQKEMKNTVSVYAIGQFSRSFVSVKELQKQGVWKIQVKSQLLLFTYFSIWICNRINRVYPKLAKQMEYDADDVAVKYIGVSTLQRTLLHAACIRYNYEVVQWGMRQLQLQNIQVDNQYLALSFVGDYSRPIRRLLSEAVVRRVERLGELGVSDNVATNNVKRSALLLAENKGQSQCSALQFAQWLRQGFVIYSKQRLLETSVEIEIHLDKRRHKLPYLDSSYELLLDGKKIGKGNFVKGYTVKCKTSPGRHKLATYALLGIISTPFEFEVEQNKSYRMEMDYKMYVKDGVCDVFVEKFYVK